MPSAQLTLLALVTLHLNLIRWFCLNPDLLSGLLSSCSSLHIHSVAEKHGQAALHSADFRLKLLKMRNDSLTRAGQGTTVLSRIGCFLAMGITSPLAGLTSAFSEACVYRKQSIKLISAEVQLIDNDLTFSREINLLKWIQRNNAQMQSGGRVLGCVAG